MAKPGGRITQVFDLAAEREGTFRFLENDDVPTAAIRAAATRAAARRAAEHEYVFVPADGTSLSIKDLSGGKGLGVIGSRRVGATGLQVMTAIAVAPDGTPLGLCSQRYWTRTERSTAVDEKRDNRPLAEKETRYWLEVLEETREVFATEASSTWPWFQLDRGGDAGAVLLDAVGFSDKAWLTVRAAYDRRLVDRDPGDHLLSRVAEQEPAGFYDLDMPAGKNRTARKANIQLRFASIAVGVAIPEVGRAPVPLWVVVATEVDTTPPGESPIEWRLYTTHPVASVADAALVVFGYSQRWRIEQFHNMWKTGACHVEDTQLQDLDHILRWATILSSVALRILRLTYISRVAPNVPATAELRPVEIEAVILLRRPQKIRRRGIPPLGSVVRWIADLGGYTGKSSGGPPGARVIARGLARIEPIVEVLLRGQKM